jgi:hypothetical protein
VKRLIIVHRQFLVSGDTEKGSSAIHYAQSGWRHRYVIKIMVNGKLIVSNDKNRIFAF